MEWKINAARFIELHAPDGTPIAINLAGISAFGHLYKTPNYGCWIALIGSSTLDIVESYDDIKNAIASRGSWSD
jgi:hypothetical protein